jgi:hypothetical protein
LFIVPWRGHGAERAEEALVTCWRRLDVARDHGAGIAGRSMQSSGMMMLIGFRQPAFIGMSPSTITRKQ